MPGRREMRIDVMVVGSCCNPSKSLSVECKSLNELRNCCSCYKEAGVDFRCATSSNWSIDVCIVQVFGAAKSGMFKSRNAPELGRIGPIGCFRRDDLHAKSRPQ
jgi:hypothetical protein